MLLSPGRAVTSGRSCSRSSGRSRERKSAGGTLQPCRAKSDSSSHVPGGLGSWLGFGFGFRFRFGFGFGSGSG